MRCAVSPKILADPETAGLGLATARQCTNLFVAIVALGALSTALGLPRVAGLLGGAAAFTLVVLATLRLASDIGVVRWTGAVGLLGFPVAIAWTDGAIVPAALPWLVVLPLLGTLIDGRAMGVFFALLSVLAAAVTLGGLARGEIPSSDLPTRAALALSFGSLTALITIVVGITAHYAATRTQTLHRLASAERDLARTREQALLAERLAALGTLAAGVAHEINNPMAFVSANVESVLRQLKGASTNGAAFVDVADCQAALADALTGAARVSEIVADLRTFAHAPDESLRPVDAEKLFGAVSRIVHNELRHRGALTIEIEPGLSVEGSESRLAQVLVNLLTNAVQAMPERPIQDNRITLRARALTRDLVEIEVSDNGVGMSAEVQARVFEPFFTTKPVGVGTGLGLYVCRNLLLAMNGRLSITSEQGVGTCVKLEIGRGRGVAPAAAASLTLPPPLRRRSVLIVDDEPLVGRALARMLRGRSDVTTVSNVEEALAAVDGTHFDAILCDVMMPGRGGAEFLREIETRDGALAERVGFITGGVFDARSHALLDRVQGRWISKPCDTSAVESLLDRLSDGGGESVPGPPFISSG